MGKVFERFSSRARLKKIVACILHYKSMLHVQSQRRKANQKISYQSNAGKITPLSVSKIKEGEGETIKCMQNQSFKGDRQILRGITKEAQEKRSKGTVKKFSSIYKLDPVLENSLI